MARSPSPSGAEGDPLERHLALEQLVGGPPHDAEAARAEALVQAVALEHQLGGGRARRRGAPEDAPRGRLERRVGRAPGGAISVRCESTGLRVRRGGRHSLPGGPEVGPVSAKLQGKTG